MRLSHCPSWRHSGHPQNNLYVASPHFHNILCTLQSFHASYNLLAPWKGSYDKPRQGIKKQRHPFADKGPYSWSYGLFSSHVWMWVGPERRLSTKELIFPIKVLEKTLESLLNSKEIKPFNPKGNQLNIYRKDWYWSSNTSATWCIEPTYWKRSWCWERLKAKEVGSRGWDS